MNFLTGDHEFYDLRLFECAETYIYAFEYLGNTHYCETVAGPSARELTDAILSTIKET